MFAKFIITFFNLVMWPFRIFKSKMWWWRCACDSWTPTFVCSLTFENVILAALGAFIFNRAYYGLRYTSTKDTCVLTYKQNEGKLNQLSCSEQGTQTALMLNTSVMCSLMKWGLDVSIQRQAPVFLTYTTQISPITSISVVIHSLTPEYAPRLIYPYNAPVIRSDLKELALIDRFHLHDCVCWNILQRPIPAVFHGTSIAGMIIPVGVVMCILIRTNVHFPDPAFFTANVFLAVNTLRSSNAATDK